MAVGDRSPSGDPGDPTGNVFQGSGDNVVQAHDIRGDIHLHAREPAPPVPRQLPATTAHFVNRGTELARLDGYLAPEAERPTSVVISAIAGTPGAGKTALAIHWGHRVRERFPDGDLYVNLRGYDPRAPMTSGQALEHFLHALGVPARTIPADPEAKAALYRSVLDDRRVLVVLDNAVTPDQIRPLIPAAPGCLALVTSRNRMSGLVVKEGAHAMSLNLLTAEEGLALLRETVGADRVDDEPDASAELVRRCGFLPLALRIVAERAISSPADPLADLAAELAAERERLDALTSLDDDEASVRAVFSWSYTALNDEAARMFQLLGLFPGPSVSLHAAAALAAVPPKQARRVLTVLVNAHLVEQTDRERYRFHDLVRAYAAECAEEHKGGEEWEAALDRMFAWYLHTTNDAESEVTGGHDKFVTSLGDLPDGVEKRSFENVDDATYWLDLETENITDLVRHAAGKGRTDTAWKLCAKFMPHLRMRRSWEVFKKSYDAAVISARSSDDKHGEAAILHGLGILHFDRHEHQDALECFQQEYQIWNRIGSDWSKALALESVSTASGLLGRTEEAFAAIRNSLSIREAINDDWGKATGTASLGILYRDSGELEKSREMLNMACSIMNDIDWKIGEGVTLYQLAEIYENLDEKEKAIESLRRGRELSRTSNDLWAMAVASEYLGRLLAEVGETEEAHEMWKDSLAVFEIEDSNKANEVRNKLSETPHKQAHRTD